MTRHPARHPDLPDDDEAAATNTDFLAGHLSDTGLWDDHGRPMLWPDNLDDWRPSSDSNSHPINLDY